MFFPHVGPEQTPGQAFGSIAGLIVGPANYDNKTGVAFAAVHSNLLRTQQECLFNAHWMPSSASHPRAGLGPLYLPYDGSFYLEGNEYDCLNQQFSCVFAERLGARTGCPVDQ
jgi:hypothetical protein